MWPQRSPKDGPRMSKIKIYQNISKHIQNIYKIYQHISEIIINIDKNHKTYIYFSKKSKLFWHLEHIRMVPHLGLQVYKLYKIVSESGSEPSVFHETPSPVRNIFQK